jgi:transcriptional regulator with XRE-family HTH domain
MYSKDQRLEIGRRLQQLRGARDQRTFAEAVGSVQQTISKYERGEIPRSWLFLARLAEEEHIDLNELLAGTNRRGEVGGGEPEERYEANGHGHGRTAGRQGAGEEERVLAARSDRATVRL